jgi:hypothetical protein
MGLSMSSALQKERRAAICRCLEADLWTASIPGLAQRAMSCLPLNKTVTIRGLSDAIYGYKTARRK